MMDFEHALHSRKNHEYRKLTHPYTRTFTDFSNDSKNAVLLKRTNEVAQLHLMQ